MELTTTSKILPLLLFLPFLTLTTTLHLPKTTSHQYTIPSNTPAECRARINTTLTTLHTQYSPLYASCTNYTTDLETNVTKLNEVIDMVMDKMIDVDALEVNCSRELKSVAGDVEDVERDVQELERIFGVKMEVYRGFSIGKGYWISRGVDIGKGMGVSLEMVDVLERCRVLMRMLGLVMEGVEGEGSVLEIRFEGDVVGGDLKGRVGKLEGRVGEEGEMERLGRLVDEKRGVLKGWFMDIKMAVEERQRRMKCVSETEGSSGGTAATGSTGSASATGATGSTSSTTSGSNTGTGSVLQAGLQALGNNPALDVFKSL